MTDIDKIRAYLNQPKKVKIAQGVEIDLYPVGIEDYPKLYSILFALYDEGIELNAEDKSSRGKAVMKILKNLSEEQIKDLIDITYHSLSQGNIDEDLAKQIAARYWIVLIPELVELSMATI